MWNEEIESFVQTQATQFLVLQIFQQRLPCLQHLFFFVTPMLCLTEIKMLCYGVGISSEVPPLQ